MNTQRAYLLHAIDAIDAVVRYTEDGRDAFFADRKTQDAVIRNVEVLGQAVKGLAAETRAHDDTIPWRQIAGMRDKLIHEYFGVDLALVWDVIARDLPALRPKIAALLDIIPE
ncbi:MAG: HepT-like ribonuclease domain-containing protein [Solirubrobacteraceae bacterium]